MSDSQELSTGYLPHPALESDINAIIDHYLEQGSPEAAPRVISSIFAMIESLIPTEVRHRGHRRYDLTDRPLLFVSVYDYLIGYAPDDEPMYVIAILHGRRDHACFLRSSTHGTS